MVASEPRWSGPESYQRLAHRLNGNLRPVSAIGPASTCSAGFQAAYGRHIAWWAGAEAGPFCEISALRKPGERL
jgi:hypothetical protein